MADNVRPDNENLMNCNITNSSVRLNSTGSSMMIRLGNILESSSCSSATMVNSLCPNMWNQPAGLQNLGFSGINVHDSEAVPNALGCRSSGLDPLRDGFDSITGLGWGSPDALLKGGMFLPGAAGLLSQGLPHFPADSGFIERAARYSCFHGGNFGEILNPFSANEALNPESESLASIQRSREVFSHNGLKPMLEPVLQENEINMAESSKRVCSSAGHGVSEGSSLKIEKHSDGLGRSNSEAKLGVNDLSNDSQEADFSGRGGQIGESSRAASIKKRKRSGPDSDLDQYMGPREPQAESDKDQRALEQKGKQNLTSTCNKSGGKNGKQGPQASDSPKEEYIHVRARRGHATNSHSLAERVRREKISERMKFLQDLVPGCSKVTGKAVMLDEIINYVQSLQRQVEFLSMKLATVNPQLDFNLERLLTKDIIQSGAGPSSSLALPPDIPMSYPSSHQSHGIAQTGLQGLLDTADVLRRSMNSSFTAIVGGLKGPSSHVSTSWEDELRNAIQMGLISTTSISSHDMSGSLPTTHTRPEL